jgi:GTP:adenosylcobinamide-phosphate guanylyltransferase
VGIPAIVAAGDSRAAKAVYGQSKVYLEVAGLPLVAHVVRTLQDCPEIDSVWVVGDSSRLETVLEADAIQRSLCKPLHIVAQQRDLISNCWETYRRILANDSQKGRDPGPDDLDRAVLVLSGDLPLATPQEISAFVQQAQLRNVDYVLGLCSAESLDVFQSTGAEEAVGISVAYFNTLDGRFRQSNLHYARPGRIGRRDRIQEMYEFRHQRRFWNMFTLALRLLFSRFGGLKIAVLFGVMHLAGVADRYGFGRLARLLARRVSLEVNRVTISRLLDTRFAFAITEGGGCALDVDTEQEYDAICARYDEWLRSQRERVAKLYGSLPSGLEDLK